MLCLSVKEKEISRIVADQYNFYADSDPTYYFYRPPLDNGNKTTKKNPILKKIYISNYFITVVRGRT